MLVPYLSSLASEGCLQEIGEDWSGTEKSDLYIPVRHLYTQGRKPALQQENLTFNTQYSHSH